MRLTKQRANALEKVFAAEISGSVAPIHQSKAKVYRDMEAEGMVEEATVILGGRFPVRIKGWALTHRGRIAYCQWASKQSEPVA